MMERNRSGNRAAAMMEGRLIACIIAAGSLNFCGVVVETSMNVTFPALMREFEVGTATVQWVTTAYLLTLAVCIPVFAYLRRRFSTRALFIGAIALFLCGTVAGAIAPAFAVLLMGRVLQGVGASIGLPLMYDIIINRVPAPKVGLMMGVASLITAVAPTIGPSLGGLMVSVASWRMIFIVLAPVVVAALALGLSGMRGERETLRGTISFDVRGFLLLAFGFSALVLGINEAALSGWLGVRTLMLFALAAAFIGAFGMHATRATVPVLSIRPLAQRGFAFALVPVMGVQLIILGLGYLIPNFAQLVLGADSLQAGTIMLPGCILAASLSPLSGKLLDRVGATVPVCTGMVAVVLAPALYAIAGSRLSVSLMVALYVLFGFGQGNTLGNCMTNALKRLPGDLAADGNAIANTAQQLASAFGTSLASTCVASAQASGTDMAFATLSGSVTAFWMLAVVGIIAGVGFLLSLRAEQQD